MNVHHDKKEREIRTIIAAAERHIRQEEREKRTIQNVNSFTAGAVVKVAGKKMLFKQSH